MEQAPWLAVWPGLCLTIVVFSLNMFGDAVRDLLDPRLRGGGGRLGALGAGAGGAGSEITVYAEITALTARVTRMLMKRHDDSQRSQRSDRLRVTLFPPMGPLDSCVPGAARPGADFVQCRRRGTMGR